MCILSHLDRHEGLPQNKLQCLWLIYVIFNHFWTILDLYGAEASGVGYTISIYTNAYKVFSTFFGTFAITSKYSVNIINIAKGVQIIMYSYSCVFTLLRAKDTS